MPSVRLLRSIHVKLGWNGPLVLTDAATVLTAGKDSFGKPLMFSPNPVLGGSSVSHWDITSTPNQLMEPNINGNLTHNVTPPSDLTFSELREIGWVSNPLPNAISVTTGNDQSTVVNTPFAISFSVTASPAVAGLKVTFTANPSPGEQTEHSRARAPGLPSPRQTLLVLRLLPLLPPMAHRDLQHERHGSRCGHSGLYAK